MDRLKQTFREIMPTRTKRGLINGLGSFIKDITGNLDNRDLIDIQNTFNNIYENQETLNHQINDQIHFNAQMVRRLEDIQNCTMTNINRLKYEVEKSTRNTNMATLVLLYDQHFYKLNHVIEHLYDHLENLLEMIQSSKNRIISRHLLTTKEHDYIEQIMKNNNIQFPNINAIFNLVTVKGFYNKTNIIFSIEIPQFTSEEFNYYQIKTIPRENKIIYPSNPNEIIISQETFQFVKKPCKNIYSQYFCEKTEIRSISKSCEAAIISQRPANCSFQLVTPTLDIDYITYGQLYIQPVGPMKYNSTCKQQSMYIRTQTLIKFENCEITIGDETYSTMETTEREIYDIYMPFNDIQILTIAPEITLQNLHNYSITNLREMELLHRKQVFHSSTGHLSLSFIIFVVICVIVHRIIKHRILSRTKAVPGPLNSPCTTLKGEESYTMDNVTTSKNNNNDVASTMQSRQIQTTSKATTTTLHLQSNANSVNPQSDTTGVVSQTTTQPFKLWER